MSGTSSIDNQFTINGVLDPNNTVLDNLEKLATSSGCWLTYDVHDGLWSVIINQAGTSTKSFDDSNIIGSIQVSGTGITEIYNKVKVNYPRSDINDQVDYVTAEIAAADRNTAEPDNVLEMNLDLVNDPVQAELIGVRELKQSRVDLLLTFETDYTAIDLKAGDIIDVTNTQLGFSGKLFRILTMEEVDTSDGSIRIAITALEYDADVYNNDLSRLTRTNTNGIVTLGDIGTPAAPQITLFQRDARPRAVFEVNTPTGTVEGVEFWTSTDGSSYDIAGTTRPFDLGAYASNTPVELELDNLQAGNIYCKVRGINAQTTGPFGSVASSTYTPVQVTNAIDPNTEVQDVDGTLLTAAALSQLIVLLDDLMSDGDSGGGSIFEKIFDIFETTTGVDVTDTANAFISNSFANVEVSGQSTLTSNGLDTLTLEAGTNMTITTDALTNTVTFESTGSGTGNLIASVLAGNGISITGNASTITVSSDGKWDGATKYVSTTQPAGASDGDIWFEI